MAPGFENFFPKGKGGRVRAKKGKDGEKGESKKGSGNRERPSSGGSGPEGENEIMKFLQDPKNRPLIISALVLGGTALMLSTSGPDVREINMQEFRRSYLELGRVSEGLLFRHPSSPHRCPLCSTRSFDILRSIGSKLQTSPLRKSSLAIQRM